MCSSKKGAGALWRCNKQPEGDLQQVARERNKEGFCRLCQGPRLPPRRPLCEVSKSLLPAEQSFKVLVQFNYFLVEG